MLNYTKKSAYFILIIVNLIYGGNYSIAKAVMPRFIEPFGFIFFRVYTSLILFGLIYLVFLREKIQKDDWIRFFFCGLFGIALNQLMFFKGVSMTSSVHGALLMITTPIITYIASNILIGEKFKQNKLLGISVGLLGASILILSSVQDTDNSSPIGDMYVILNAISFSIYLILVKPLMSKYHPLTITFLCFLMGSIWVGIAGFEQAMSFDITAVPRQYFWQFGYVILCATFLVYFLNIIAIHSVSPTTVSSFIYLQPFFAILISIFFTDERLSLYTSLGGILIIFGLWLINHKK